MEAHPRAQFAEFARQIGHVCADLLTVPHARLVADVDTVSRRILADHEQFARARFDQLFGFAQDRVGAAADEVAAQARDDAEGAAMVAALGDLQIAVMPRGELEPAFGDEIEERARRHRGGGVDRADDLFVLMRAGDCEDARELRADHLRFLAHAAGDDDATVLGDRLADRFERFFLGGIEEAAGVDQHDVSPRIIGRHGIAIGAQLGQDPLAIDQILGTAERDHADLRRGGECCCHGNAST
jgi:hypothetical protein